MKKLSLDNLSFSFGKKILLKNVNLSINNNDTILLIGLNGTGKTTLLKYIINKYKQNCSFMIENAGIYENYTGLDNLKIYAIKYKIKYNELLKYIKLCGLESIINNYVSKYSYGEKMRLKICKTIIKNADIYIFDEPLNGLDYKAIEIFKNILIELKNNNKIVIVSSHQIKTLEGLINKYWHINNKNVEENTFLNINSYVISYTDNINFYTKEYNCSFIKLNEIIETIIKNNLYITNINYKYFFEGDEA